MSPAPWAMSCSTPRGSKGVPTATPETGQGFTLQMGQEPKKDQQHPWNFSDGLNQKQDKQGQ